MLRRGVLRRTGNAWLPAGSLGEPAEIGMEKHTSYYRALCSVALTPRHAWRRVRGHQRLDLRRCLLLAAAALAGGLRARVGQFHGNHARTLANASAGTSSMYS